MTKDLKILIIDCDESNGKMIVDHLSKNKYEVFLSNIGSAAIDIVKKNQINLILIDIALPDISGVALIEEINKTSPSVEFILVTENLSHKDMLYLSALNIKYGYLEKPVDFKKLDNMLKKINNSKKDFFTIQENLNDMFESYNQLEFLMTILFNDYERSTERLGVALKNYSIDKLTEQQAISTIKQVYNGNNRLITSYNNLRSVSNISPNDFTKQDVVLIIKNKLDEMKLHSECKIKLAKQFKSGKFYVKGTYEGLTILFFEILKSLTVPETNLCKSLEIGINKSDENLSNAIEIEIKTILHEIEDVYQDSIMDPSTYQYGFSYFVVRNLVKIFDGKLLLSDTKKEGLTETTMVVILSQH